MMKYEPLNKCNHIRSIVPPKIKNPVIYLSFRGIKKIYRVSGCNQAFLPVNSSCPDDKQTHNDLLSLPLLTVFCGV